VATQRGLMMSLAHWREFLKPRLAAVIADTRKARGDVLIRYHCDGDPSEIIPDLIEIGVDTLNPVQPECMDIAWLKREYGGDLSFWGAVGIQSTLPFGTPAQVRQTIRTTIEQMAAGGGLYLSPTHILQADVPWENLLAFVEAAKEFGKY
jgi:uroporphyrinogen decarboxylase